MKSRDRAPREALAALAEALPFKEGTGERLWKANAPGLRRARKLSGDVEVTGHVERLTGELGG
jgi:hypothetical protein